MMLGKALHIFFLSDLAHMLLILGICAGAAAYGAYIMRWLKKPYPVSYPSPAYYRLFSNNTLEEHAASKNEPCQEIPFDT